MTALATQAQVVEYPVNAQVVAFDRSDTTKVDVTPELAAMWLARNTLNRKKRPALVDKYAADIAAGRWRWTHQGIAFDRDGRLLDGQHRLEAIVKVGVAISLNVTTGVSSDAQLVIDDHARRTLVDYDSFRRPDRPLTKTHVAVATAMIRSVAGATRRTTRSSQYDFIERHRDAIDFAITAIPMTRRITIAPVLAVLARAYYTQPCAKLVRFGEVLIHGIGDPAIEEAAMRLGRYLLQGSAPIGGEIRHAMVYGKVERALQAFLRGESLQKLYEAKEELFPLPEEPS